MIDEALLLAVLTPDDLEDVLAAATCHPAATDPELVGVLRAWAQGSPPEGSHYRPAWWSPNLELRARLLDTAREHGVDAALAEARVDVHRACVTLLNEPTWVAKREALERFGYVLLDRMAVELLDEFADRADREGKALTAVELRQHARLLQRVRADRGTDAIDRSFSSGEDPAAGPEPSAALESLLAMGGAAECDPRTLASAGYDLLDAICASGALPGLHVRILHDAMPVLAGSASDPEVRDLAIAAARVASGQVQPDADEAITWLTLRASLLVTRGDVDALREAALALDRAVGLAVAGPRLLLGRADVRRRLFDEAGDPADLDAAIADATAVTEGGEEGVPDARHLLGRLLFARWQASARAEDLSAALAQLQAALESGEPVVGLLVIVADCRRMLAVDERDLDLVIEYREQLRSRHPEYGADVQVGNLIELARLYDDRSLRDGIPEELDLAIEAVGEAERLAAEAAPAQRQPAAALLGRLLTVRAQRTGRGDDIARAIDVLTLALELTDGDDRGELASAHNDLAAAYMSRYEMGVLPEWGRPPRELQRELAAQAVVHCRIAAALRLDDPHRDAAHQTNLAQALRLMASLDDDPQLLDEAIEASRAALAIADPADPYVARWTGTLAGSLMLRNADGDAAEARAALADVAPPEPQDATILAALRAEATALDIAGSSPATGDAGQYFRAALDASGSPGHQVHVAARWARWAASVGREDEAVEAYGRVAGLLRTLVERQSVGDDLLRVAGRFVGLGDEAASALATAGRLAQAVTAVDAGHAISLRRQLDRFAPAEVAGGEPAARAARLDHPVVFFASTEAGGQAIVVDGDRQYAVPLPRLTGSALEEVGRAFLHGYDVGGRRQMRAIERTCDALWELAVGPVLAKVGETAALTLVPTSWLALLPLHAARRADGPAPRYLIDDTAVTIVPNSEAIEHGLAAGPHRRARSCLLVVEPSPVTAASLPGTALEAAVVIRLHAPTVLSGSAATKAAVLEEMAASELLHFAGHGVADARDPLAGGLVLAGDEMLSARDLPEGLLAAQLVVLAACDLARPGLLLPSEAIGLPTSLLARGARTVIAPLWPVADWSTAELMSRFHVLLEEGCTPDAALRRAQIAVRDSTVQEKQALLRAELGSAIDPWPLSSPTAQPCRRPFYWAGFTCTGVTRPARTPAAPG